MNENKQTNFENMKAPEHKSEHKGFDGWWKERSLGEKIVLGIGFALAGLALMALVGLAVMLLWNWLMPDIFGLKAINYWQSWGLMILSWILFKGMGSNSNKNGSSDRKRKKQLRSYMQENPESTTDAK